MSESENLEQFLRLKKLENEALKEIESRKNDKRYDFVNAKLEELFLNMRHNMMINGKKCLPPSLQEFWQCLVQCYYANESAENKCMMFDLFKLSSIYFEKRNEIGEFNAFSILICSLGINVSSVEWCMIMSVYLDEMMIDKMNYRESLAEMCKMS